MLDNGRSAAIGCRNKVYAKACCLTEIPLVADAAAYLFANALRRLYLRQLSKLVELRRLTPQGWTPHSCCIRQLKDELCRRPESAKRLFTFVELHG